MDTQLSRKINKIAMLCPTRRRLDNTIEVFNTWVDTQGGYSSLIFIVDEDDTETYISNPDIASRMVVVPKGRPGIVDATNMVAKEYCTFFEAIGFMGDDHRFRTIDWDYIMLKKVKESNPNAVVYGDDLYQHNQLPTSVVLDSGIVEKLGYMAPPILQHMYVDNFWKDIGEKLGTLYYMPEVVIEHMHYTCGKSKIDGSYAVTTPLISDDGARYQQYMMNGDFNKDLEKLRNEYNVKS